MRIAIVTWSSRRAGGTQAYIETVIAGLRSAGHETALFCEVDQPARSGAIALPAESPVWRVSNMGVEQAIGALRRWHPDLIYAHGLVNPTAEALTLEVGPAVFFAHNYHGTCLSGAKTFKYRTVRACSRRFGWPCLAHFYPHRCGGLNPVTMWSEFWHQSWRLKTLRSYQAIITASEHMRSEYLKLGFLPETVRVIRLPVHTPKSESISGEDEITQSALSHQGDLAVPFRLLFAGRMDFLKGGEVLIDALPKVLDSVRRPLQMTFAGDGPERQRWEEKASRLRSNELRIKFHFTGWLEHPRLENMFRESDLLVVPSLWPEPFGLVGLEAGLYSLPVAAFAVGGIPEWLTDGVNGHLALDDPPSVSGLARAIAKCLCDPVSHARLRRGALEITRQFSLTNHIRELMRVFENVTGGSPDGVGAGTQKMTAA
jgi:glycosyltransferase involved in cell wall biosynthesis